MTTTTIEAPALSLDARLTLALDALPIRRQDREAIVRAFEWAEEQPVSDYDAEEWYGTTGHRAWLDARGIVLLRYASDQWGKQLDAFVYYEPRPTKAEIVDAVELAADEWKAELA